MASVWRRDIPPALSTFRSSVPAKTATLTLTADAAFEPVTDLRGAALRLLGREGGAVDWDGEIRRHGRRVVLSLLARGIRPERAKELAQDAWLRVIQQERRGALREVRLPALVIAQAQFLALDDRRREEHRFTHDTLDESLTASVEFERRVAARDDLRTIERVVSAAHRNAQRVFRRLYGGEGLSASDIATELGLSEQRVRQIACELRAKIRDALAEGGHR